MRKNVKLKKGALSILLVLGLVLATLSPLGAWAEEAMISLVEEGGTDAPLENVDDIVDENKGEFTQKMLQQALNARDAKDVSHLFPDEKITKKVVQNGKVLGDDTKVDTSKPVSVTLNFDVPVIGDFKGKVDDITQVDPDKYVISGDKARINVGLGVKLKDKEKYDFDIVDRDNNKIGKAVFKEEGNKIVVDFDFEGTVVYDGTREEVKVELAANFDLDTSSLPPVPGEDQTIEILGKTYKIEKPADNIIVKKVGEVNYNDNGCSIYGCGADEYPDEPDNMSITWTVTVSRKGVGGNPVPLAGYKFTDNLKPVGKYQIDTFKINDVSSNDFTYNENTGELSYVFPEGNATEATIKFNTRLTMSEFRSGTTKRNTAKILDKTGKYVGGNEGIVEWRPQWGKKNAKRYGNASFRKENGKYYIDWQIEFNNNSYNLTNVRIVDTLKAGIDGTGTIFEKAVLEKNTGTVAKPVWEKLKEFDDYPAVKEEKNPQYIGRPVFEVGNISFPVKLTITVRIDTNAALTNIEEFENHAVVLWGFDWFTEFTHKIKVGDGGIITKKPVTVNGYQPFEHVWNIEVKKNSIIDKDKTFAYDAMIFDPSVNMWRINKGHEDADLRVEGDDGRTSLQSGIALKKVIFEHGIFNKYVGDFTSVSPDNLKHNRYKVFLKDKYIGDIIEVWNFDKDQDNKFSFKARVVTPRLILGLGGSNYNKTHLIHEGKEIDNADYWSAYRGRMLQKQALTADTAKKIIEGTISSDTVNENVYDAQVPEAVKDPLTEKKALNNKLTAYNKDDNSIIYRLSINAEGIHGINEHTGATVIEDILPGTDWKFVPIKGSENYLLYEGESFSKSYSKEAVVEAKNDPIQGPEGFSAEVNGQKAKFTFNKLDKPYVILLKVQLKDKNTLANKKGTLRNTASLTLKGSRIISFQDVDYDRGTLNKELDAKNIDKGYITWTIEYKPYKFQSNNPPYMEDKLGAGLEIRRNANGKLSFNNDNYQLIEGYIDNNGKFKEEKRLSTEEELKDKLSYDVNTRILTIKNFNKNKAYRFIYVTDVIDKVQGEMVSNIVTLKEGGNTTNIESPKQYIIAKAYGRGSSKGFVHFTIHKVNEEGNENLAGAEFELTYPSGVKKILKTGTDGKVKSETLRLGKTYKLKEIKAPTGYQSDSTVYEVKINELTQGFEVVLVGNNNPLVSANGPEITVKNKKKVITEADVTLVKADITDAPEFAASHSLADIKHPLAKAEFRLIKKDDPAVSHSAITGSDGKLKFTGVKQGTYILKEEKAPKGYTSLMTKKYEVVVNPNAAVGQKVQVNSGKPDPVKQANDADETIVVFNEKAADLTLIKTSLADKGAVSTGAINTKLEAKFTLEKSDNTVSYEAVTVGGTATIKGLKAGKYILKETVAPNGYNKLIDSYEITVAPGENPEITIKDAKPDEIKLLDGKVVVYNEKMINKFDLNLVKADFVDRKATTTSAIKIKLDGAKFILTYPDNTTKSAVTTNGRLTFSGLDAGVYKLKETVAPAGYGLLPNEYEITITPGAISGKRIAIKNANKNEIKLLEDNTTVAVFDEKLYDLYLVKADFDANKAVFEKFKEEEAAGLKEIKVFLAGVRFGLTPSGSSLTAYQEQTTAAIAGSLIFRGISTGTYRLEEKATIGGYDRLTSIYGITVTTAAVNAKLGRPEIDELAIISNKDGYIAKMGETLVVLNKKTPHNPGPGPGPGPGSSPGPGPSPNPNPKPNPGGELPRYPKNNFPDPNKSESPDELVSVDDDGTPQGKYVKKKKPNGGNKYIRVDDDDTPQGGKTSKEKLPKTGGSNTTVYYASGVILLLLAVGFVAIRKKKYNK